jgi:hypothetical protein
MGISSSTAGHGKSRADAAFEARMQQLTAAVRASTDLAELKQVLDETLPLLEFRHYTYVAVDIGLRQDRHLGSISQDALCLTNLDPVWTRRYHEQGYFKSDPIVRACAAGRAPVIWTVSAVRGGLGDEAELMMADAEANGIARGISVPVHGFAGELGILSLYSDLPDEVFRPLAQRQELVIQRLAFTLHDVMHRRFVSREAPRAVQDILIRKSAPSEHEH